MMDAYAGSRSATRSTPENVLRPVLLLLLDKAVREGYIRPKGCPAGAIGSKELGERRWGVQDDVRKKGWSDAPSRRESRLYLAGLCCACPAYLDLANHRWGSAAAVTVARNPKNSSTDHAYRISM